MKFEQKNEVMSKHVPILSNLIIVKLDKLNEHVSTMLVVNIEDEVFAAQ